MPKIVDLSKVQRSEERRSVIKAKLAKYKKQGEDVDMTLDEMRAAIIELQEKVIGSGR
jgi:chaperonin cofactor prefoldin